MTDLHMHSRISEDGEFSPAEIVRKCKDAGLSAMALTDHNSVSGVREAEEACAGTGMAFIPGIEIDCCFEEVDFHVLGFGIDFTSRVFADIEANVAAQYAKASAVMLNKVRSLGFDVSIERLDEITAGCYWKNRYYPEAFAEALLTDVRYLNSPLLAPYRKGAERGDNPLMNMYWEWFSQGKKCFAPLSYPPMSEIINAIHSAGGYAILAHPGNNLKDRRELLPAIVGLGIDGLEVFSSYHDEESTGFYYAEAKSRGLLMTCGSDFHGRVKPTIALGSVKYSPEVEEAVKIFTKTKK